jgi:hypothetical protein
MGLAGPVSAGELEAVLIGRHAQSGEVLLGATGASGPDRVDARLARRLIEALSGRPLTPPSEAYLLADKDPDNGDWRVTRGEVERFIADRATPETVMGDDPVCSTPKSVSLL